MFDLPVEGQGDGGPIRPGGGNRQAQPDHEGGEAEVAGEYGFGIEAAEGDGRGFDADFEVVFFVGHGVGGVVGQRPQDVGGKEQPGGGRDVAGNGGKGHRDAEGKGQAEVELGQGEEAFGERVAHGQKQCGQAHQPGQAVQRQQAERGSETERGGQQQGFFFADCAACERPVFGALDRAVEVAVGKVVDDAARAAHKEGADDESQKNG